MPGQRPKHPTPAWRLTPPRRGVYDVSDTANRSDTVSTTQATEERRMGIHLRLDRETVSQLDQAAAEAGTSRSELLRRLIADWVEQRDWERWAEEEAEAALAEPRVSWEQAKAELGL